jgi:hypothetical protein
MIRDPILACAAAALALAFVGCSSTQGPPQVGRAVADKPRITQFYPTPPAIAPGDSARLCYGIENATAARMEPPVEGVRPVFSRCVAVSPRTTTTYTLIAEGAGEPARASLTLTVDRKFARPPAPAPVGEPSASGLSFFANSESIAAGGSVMLCYQTRGASKVDITPRTITGDLPANGCVTERPAATTTYTLNAEYPGGRQERLQVKVTVQ